MPQFLKYLVLCFAVITVGAAQVVGAQVSYFCSCTGQRTVFESCEASGCHVSTRDQADCKASGEAHQNSGEKLPADSEHRHDEVLEKLVGTHSPPVLSSPVVIWVVVWTDPSLFTGTYAFHVQYPAVFDTGPPEQKPLPDGVLVAKTKVMLV